MSHAADVYRTALNAVGRLDARVLFTVGRRFDVASLGSVPSHVHVEAWVDQASVLGHADVVVCHGGSGTVLGALGAGVPVVAVPLFADQFENSRRIAAAKAGRNVIPHQHGGARSVITVADAPRITAAVQEVLADSSFRFHAGLIANEMAAMRTPDEVYGELATDI
jgi:UDP:flavonoid glycosyltransferase YjiC (YdhE family)